MENEEEEEEKEINDEEFFNLKINKKLNSGIIRRRIINNLEGGDNSKIDENT